MDHKQIDDIAHYFIAHGIHHTYERGHLTVHDSVTTTQKIIEIARAARIRHPFTRAKLPFVDMLDADKGLQTVTLLRRVLVKGRLVPGPMAVSMEYVTSKRPNYGGVIGEIHIRPGTGKIRREESSYK